MKKSIVKILAIALMLCLAVPFTACLVDAPQTEGAYAYVAIDINPSLELIAKDDVVVKVRALNDDANILLSGETIEGLSLEEATEKVVSLASELGYLNEENTDVNITVTTDDEKITKEIEEKAEKAIKRGCEIAQAVRNERSKDIEKVKELKEQNAELYDKLTPAMNRLIEQILELNPELTYEALMEMKVSELVEMLESLAKEKDEVVSEDVKKEMENRHKELKEEAKKKMDELYEKAKKDREQVIAELEELYNTIKENVELTEEDLNKIEEIVGKKPELATVEDLNSFIEELKKKAENIELSPEQKEELDKIQEEMDGFFDKVKDEFKDKIEESKNEFDKIKEQKREECKNNHQKPDKAPENDEAPEVEENEPEAEETPEVEESTPEEAPEEKTDDRPEENKNPIKDWFENMFGGKPRK
ncbi:MAG: hypothetical protein J6A95_06740 [Clostridia bacterium]|nr:hypothetical protein [Clostridia bacterium]